MTLALLAAEDPAVTAGDRRTRMLRTAMGPAIAAALEDPEVIEILLNPDGSLWLDRLGAGREPTGIFLSASDAERIIRLVAAHVRAEVHAGAPILSAELPDTGERFEGVLPPIVRAPTFAIRKRAVTVMSLATLCGRRCAYCGAGDFLAPCRPRAPEHPHCRRHQYR